MVQDVGQESQRLTRKESRVSAVANGELELGMVGAVVQKKGLSFEPCFHDDMVLIVPPGHRLADCSQASIDDLASEPFVLREKGSGTRLATERALQAAGNLQLSDLQIVAEIGSAEAIRQAVRAGLGCSIISRRAVMDDLEHGLLHAPVLQGVQLSRQFYLIWHNQRVLEYTEPYQGGLGSERIQKVPQFGIKGIFPLSMTSQKAFQSV